MKNRQKQYTFAGLSCSSFYPRRYSRKKPLALASGLLGPNPMIFCGIDICRPSSIVTLIKYQRFIRFLQKLATVLLVSLTFIFSNRFHQGSNNIATYASGDIALLRSRSSTIIIGLPYTPMKCRDCLQSFA